MNFRVESHYRDGIFMLGIAVDKRGVGIALGFWLVGFDWRAR